MFQYLGFNIFDEVSNFFSAIGSVFTPEIVFYVFVGLQTFFVLYFIVKSFFAYEFRSVRALDKLNIYLLNQSSVNESNLIEFNRLMKRVPKTLRYHWQQYMLYREKMPSHYISSENCIEKPFRSSSVISNMTTISGLSKIFVVLSFIFVYSALAQQSPPLTFMSLLFQSLIIPILIILLNSLYVMLQKIRHSVGINELYQTFHIFQRLIDKASITIPEYVDFEVLFTKKEIKQGIPVLNEYLEKRARQEQEELEKARINAVEHEIYDFGDIDINGALVLERALKETEIYLTIRQRLLSEIQQIEGEIDSLKKTFENTQKDYQRKLQASKENIERFRLQQESTTNRIESNYIRKQQSDEIKKQQQIEKDNDDTTLRYNQEMATLTQEIAKRKVDLEERRKYIENAMRSEYQTYATKIFKNIKNLAYEKEKQEKIILETENETLKLENIELKEKFEEIEIENQDLREKLFPGKKKVLVQEKKKHTSESLSNLSENKNKIQKLKTLTDKIENLVPIRLDNPIYDEFGGYYNKEGYYIYANGTYYDPLGNYHDEKGGYYDPNGEYYPPVTNTIQSEIDVLESDTVFTPIIISEPTIIKDENSSIEVADIEETAQDEEFGSSKKISVESLDKPKRKPGRPRKEKTEGDEINKPKGKPGRPKKIVSEEDLNKPKRKPGRPKKVVSKEDEKLVKRPRGRPRKDDGDGRDITEIQNQIRKEQENIIQQQKELSESLSQTIEEIDE